MRIVSGSQVHSEALAILGFATEGPLLNSSEALAAAIRRAASFLCPCSARTIIRAVISPLKYIVEDDDELQTATEDVLEEIIALGDLQECRNVSFNRSALLYLAPPSYVPLSGGTVILLGVAPDNGSFLPEDMQRNVVCSGCMRYLRGDDLVPSLSHLGLIRYSEEDWLNAPPDEAPSRYISRFECSLDRATECRDITGVTVLNPAADVRYYRGRWSPPKAMSGRYIGRRPQAYGNDIWCYLETERGRPRRFVDLPLDSSRGLRGCDEAWRIQAAVDAHRGQPQQYRLRQLSDNAYAIDVFSPVPCWVERRWSWVGARIESRGCLLSFRFERADVEQELDFVRRKLWLTESAE